VHCIDTVFDGECWLQTSSLSSDMVGIPTADEFMKHKQEFDAKIDSAAAGDDDADDLNAGLLLVHCRLLSKLVYSRYVVSGKLPPYFMCSVNYLLFLLMSLWF